MVQPLWLSVVLGGQDDGVQEDQDDDEPEHCLNKIRGFFLGEFRGLYIC